MKIEITISENEIGFIKNYLEDQGRDVTVIQIQEAIKDYIYGNIEDSQESRVDAVMEALMDEE